MNLVANLDKREQALLSIFVILKLALIFAIPFSGDEAYFTTWATNLSPGYYDHPPMVGWGIYVLSLISDHYVFYRLFSFFTSVVVAILVYRLSRELVDEKNALLVALVFFISPVSLMMSLISNDIFLMFFGVIGAFYFFLALKDKSIPETVIAGILLGLAFLSKYFAVFLIFGLIVYALSRRDRWGIKASVIVAVTICFFILENLYYNYNNCWNNVLFNFQSRVSDSSFSLHYTSLFFATLLLLIPPHGVYLLTKNQLLNKLSGDSNVLRYALLAFGPALLVFLYVSLNNQIGLHWLLLFIPFIFLLFSSLDTRKLKSLYLYNFSVSVVTGLVILSVILFHKPLLGNSKIYYQISLFTQTSRICQQLPTGKDIFTLNYTNNSILTYFCRGNTYHVLFDVSKYGREDDKRINIKELDGKTLTIFSMHKKEIRKISDYFDSVDIKEIEIENNPNYYLLTGRNFNYSLYREKVLTVIADKFYNIPDWLPSGQCSFKEKYSF